MCKAVLGIDLSDQPLTLGGAFHMLPNALPSHPKGLDKRLFKPSYSKTLTPPNHPSEVGLPWNAHLEQLAKTPEKELNSWGWEQFFGSVVEGDSDVLSSLRFLFTPLQTSMTTSSRATSGMHRQSPQSVRTPRITSLTLNSILLC